MLSYVVVTLRVMLCMSAMTPQQYVLESSAWRCRRTHVHVLLAMHAGGCACSSITQPDVIPPRFL
jgi:hypothetical protein